MSDQQCNDSRGESAQLQAIMIEVRSKLDRIEMAQESMSEKQEEISQDVTKIKEAVYNPDEGLYARIRALETWKNTSSKMIWTLFTTIVGLVSAFIIKSFN